MPKGRGSNKTGKGPTPPKNRPQQAPQGIPPHVELMVTKSQLDEKTVQVKQLQAQVRQAMQMAIAALSTKRSKSATLSDNQLQKLDAKYAGISVEENEADRTVTLTLVEREADATEGS